MNGKRRINRRRFPDYPGIRSRMESRGRRGRPVDVDVMMEVLASATDLPVVFIVDNCLGRVTGGGGVRRIRRYLFSGNTRQRNFAANFFRRRGNAGLLARAVDRGAIDEIQACHGE